MIVNLNSIRLDPCNGQYEEYPLLPTETGNVLPGAIVAVTTVTKDWPVYAGIDGETAQSNGTRQSETDPPTNMRGVRLVEETIPAQGTEGEEGYVPASTVKKYVVDKAYVTSQAAAGQDVNGVELLVVTENSYDHGSINHKCIPGEIVHLRRAVSADRYLLRAVEGTYIEGDPVYLTQTANGIYVTKTGAAGAKPIGYAGESFVVYGEDKPELNPKFYYDAIDDSTPIRPSTRWLNGAVFNLLKVRIA